jgi:hypothetical protein
MKPRTPAERRADRAKTFEMFTTQQEKAPTRAGQPFQMSIFPGIDVLEGNLLLAGRSKSSPLNSFGDQIDSVSRAAFGITRRETEFTFPSEYFAEDTPESRILILEARYRRHEEAFEAFHKSTDEECARHLLGMGLDFTRDGRVPLHCIWLLSRQAEAAAKGLFGAHMPNTEALSISRFENDFLAARNAWMRAKRQT